MQNKKHYHLGFTIAEMVVVAGIISILAGTIFALAQSSRAQARDTRRIHDLQQIQQYVEGIKLSTGKYPITNSDLGSNTFWFSSCTGGSNLAGDYRARCLGDNSNWIDTASTIILPKDPSNKSGNGCSSGTCYAYFYGSDGYNYKLMAWTLESNSGKNQAKIDNGATADSSICPGSYTSPNNIPVKNCGGGASACERNDSGSNLNFELFSPGFHCM